MLFISQVLPSDHSVTIPRADEYIMPPLARDQLRRRDQTHHSIHTSEKVLRHPTRLHSVEENEPERTTDNKGEP